MSPMDATPLPRRHLRAGARKLLFAPVLAAAMAVSPLPASADDAASQDPAASWSQSQASTTATPAAWGRPAFVQTGRRPR
jgi:Ni/Co efflux regulator RcnB